MPPIFSRAVMTLSACALGLLGATGSFLPAEVLVWLGTPATPIVVLLVQAYGASLLGFAMLNWMSRRMTLGGIYGRPLVVGNLLHFGAGGIGAVKLLRAYPEAAKLWPLAVVYVVFAVACGILMLRSPAMKAPHTSPAD
jgi:hypothetical protein